MEIKVGTLLKGTENREYFITNEKMTKSVVVKIEKDWFWVKILEHEFADQIGKEYMLNSNNIKYFDIIEKNLDNLVPGDILELRDDLEDNKFYGGVYFVESMRMPKLIFSSYKKKFILVEDSFLKGILYSKEMFKPIINGNKIGVLSMEEQIEEIVL